MQGWESVFEKHSTGDEFQATVLPSYGYGGRHDALHAKVSRSPFVAMEGEVEVGVPLHVATNTNDNFVMAVVAAGDEIIADDGNQPLADATLCLAMAIRSVRDAVKEEITLGRTSGDG